MKVNRHGQAAVMNQREAALIRRALANPKHRLIFDVARFTGERIGAVLQLKVNDVYSDTGRPLNEITFRASTRKRSATGERHTRQCPTHSDLLEILTAYDQPVAGFLFPGDRKHLTYQAFDTALRRAIRRAGLSHKGFSTHSFRRTVITRLSELGTDLRTIQQITGHQDLKSLQRYIEADPKRVARAINML